MKVLYAAASLSHEWGVFSRKQEPEVERLRNLVAELYKKIGERDIELEF